MATENQKAALQTFKKGAVRFLDEEEARLEDEVKFLKKIQDAQGLDQVKAAANQLLTNELMDALQEWK